MKQFTFLFIVGLCVANILAKCVVQTPLGPIKGTRLKSRSGKTIYACRGVPYGESTAGRNRFCNPVPKKKWDHILVADHDRCECPQLTAGVVHGCEDCLHLNIYTPEPNPKVLLPCMVYIPSGDNIQKNNSLSSDGPEYLLDHANVVLVVINYRLDILGFLSTGDSAAPGNYGLKDQALALKWVKEYIKFFGGNPEEITVFGEGAGSEYVNHHLLSNVSQRLFQQAICQSGVSLSPGAVAVGPSYYEKVKKVAELLKCPTKDSHKMIECLRKLHVTEIMKVSLQVFDDIEIAAQRTWRPTVEPKGPGAFLTATPDILIQENKLKRCRLIFGNVKDEGTYFAEKMMKSPKLYDRCLKDPVAVIIRLLKYYSPLDGMNVTDIAVKAKNFYIGTGVPKSKEDLLEGFTNCVTDFFYVFQTLQFTKYLQRIEPDTSYAYLFDYLGTITSAMNFPGKLSKTLVGHGSEIFSEFPTSGAYIDPKYSSLKPSGKDYKMIEIFTDLWTSFANNRFPSSDKLKNSHLWQPIRNTTKHLKIGNGDSIEVTLEVKYSSRVNFWFENVPQYCMDSGTSRSPVTRLSENVKHSNTWNTLNCKSVINVMCFRLQSYRNNTYKNESFIDKKTLLFNVVMLTLIGITIFTVMNFWFFLDEPKIMIGEGYVLGTTMRTRNGRKIFAFLGIPYAEAPLKNLRFRNPVPKRAWRGTLKAQKEGHECLQFHEGTVVGNENCLTLNIYTPKVKRTDLLPVMVFIHGGGYLTGNSSRHLYGPNYLLDKDILFVTLNYRLGLFGFLSTGDAAAPGNFGLKDQVLALKWVRRNIRAFGGNRNEVLLVGHNAGATCVHLHSISNSSKHLFNSYIMQSNIAIPSTGFRFDRSYFHSAKRLGSNNNCSTNDSYSLVNCLRRSSAIKLMKTSLIFTHLQELLQIEWGPVVEPQSMGAFLTESPITLVERCELKKSPFVMGFVPDEATSILQSLYLNDTAYNFFVRDPSSMMEKILQNIYFMRSKNTTYIAIEAKKFYLGTDIPKEKEEVLHGISQFLTDIIVLYPSMYYRKYVTEHCGREIYVYLFNYRGTTNTLLDLKDFDYFDDTNHLFPRNSTSTSLNYDIKQTSSNRNISVLMVDLWTSFATTSIPTSILLEESSMWKPYSNNSSFLQIGNISDATTTLQTSLFAERMRFLHNMYYYT
ncbi:uncharacterized protein LOC143208489 [Lasioglossum baleicum]|uniref:uncharacterized protein LOC143208489 n=1 Tax=Lasioglossum baleicum TaxID=434251 RepID=UPI003FCCF0D3